MPWQIRWTNWKRLPGRSRSIESPVSCVSRKRGYTSRYRTPTLEVRCYPSNKPWVTSDLKALLNEKKRAFRSGYCAERFQRELKLSIRESKENYRRKLESKLENNNARDVWGGMREITGFQREGVTCFSTGSTPTPPAAPSEQPPLDTTFHHLLPAAGSLLLPG